MRQEPRSLAGVSVLVALFDPSKSPVFTHSQRLSSFLGTEPYIIPIKEPFPLLRVIEGGDRKRIEDIDVE